MVNYKTFQITDIYTGSDYLGFSLNDAITFSDGTKRRIDCKKVSPYTSYGKYDQIEVDLDHVRSYSSGYEFNNTSVVRKTTLALIPSSSAYGSSSLISRSTRLDVSEIRNQVNEVNNNPSRNGYEDERLWRDSSGEYYEHIEYTKDHASYHRTRKW